MGKALMVNRGMGGVGSGLNTNLFGTTNTSGTEANTQASVTETVDFTNLRARITAGNSGSATFQFRDAGANGQNVTTITGVADGEDTTHTDTLTSGDLFNLAYTDTGTDSTTGWIAANVTFASGHGNFHGASVFGSVVFDVASSTRFINITGNIAADGNATEDNVEWKVRGYTSFEAFQVRVTANSRTNTSSFRNRINGADGSLLVEYATGATGLVSDSSPADSLSDGQTINLSITLDTGVQDLNVSLVAATLKSSTNKSETCAGNQAGLARTASATAHYINVGGYIASLTSLTEAGARLKPGFAATVSNLRCYLSANTYGGAGTLKLYQNGSAVITTTIGAGGGAAWYENTSDTITIDADDELSFEFDEGTSGSITIHSVGITFAPTATNNDASSTGTSTAIAQGASTAQVAASSTGTATATAAGAATAEAVISSAGTSTAEAAGEALAPAAASSAGTATAEATAQSTGEAAMDAAGTGTAESTGASTSEAAINAAGVATAEAAGAAEASAVISAAGTADAQALGASTAEGVMNAAGLATAQAVGQAVTAAADTGAMDSTGLATAEASGSATVEAAGLSAGVSTGTAEGAATATAEMSAAGTSAAQAEGSALATAVMSADGSATSEAVGSATVTATMSSDGAATAEAEGVEISPIAAGAGSSAGEATAEAVGVAVGAAVVEDDDMRMRRHWIEQQQVFLQETREEEAELFALAEAAVARLSHDYLNQYRGL